MNIFFPSSDNWTPYARIFLTTFLTSYLPFYRNRKRLEDVMQFIIWIFWGAFNEKGEDEDIFSIRFHIMNNSIIFFLFFLESLRKFLCLFSVLKFSWTPPPLPPPKCLKNFLVMTLAQIRRTKNFFIANLVRKLIKCS